MNQNNTYTTPNTNIKASSAQIQDSKNIRNTYKNTSSNITNNPSSSKIDHTNVSKIDHPNLSKMGQPRPIIEKHTPMKELIIMNNEGFGNFNIDNLDIIINHLLPPIPSKHPSGICTLYEFVQNYVPLINKYLRYPEGATDQPLAHGIAALMVRCIRFQIRFVTLATLLNNVDRPALAINVKRDRIIKSLKDVTVILDYKSYILDPKKGITKKDPVDTTNNIAENVMFNNIVNNTQPMITFTELTLKMTLNKIVDELRKIESMIKECFLPLSHFFDYLHLENQANNAMFQAIDSIAPPITNGYEADYHYVWRLFLLSKFPLPNQYHPLATSPAMSKQWETYVAEIDPLLSILSKRMKSPYDLSILMSSPIPNSNIINQPFSKFLTKPCQKNTFSRIVACTEHLIPILYAKVITEVSNSRQ